MRHLMTVKAPSVIVLQKIEAAAWRHVFQILTELQEQVLNNAWGVSSVKDINDQTQADLRALKARQQENNDTMKSVRT